LCVLINRPNDKGARSDEIGFGKAAMECVLYKRSPEIDISSAGEPSGRDQLRREANTSRDVLPNAPIKDRP
jgi:hypothetical protein